MRCLSIFIMYYYYYYYYYSPLDMEKKSFRAYSVAAILTIYGTCKVISHVESFYFYVSTCWNIDFPPVQTGPGADPASCTMGTGSFQGVKYSRGVLLTTHPPLVLRAWKSRAIPLPTLWAMTRPVTGSLCLYHLLDEICVHCPVWYCISLMPCLPGMLFIYFLHDFQLPVFLLVTLFFFYSTYTVLLFWGLLF